VLYTVDVILKPSGKVIVSKRAESKLTAPPVFPPASDAEPQLEAP
jgi:hypothetical protein